MIKDQGMAAVGELLEIGLGTGAGVELARGLGDNLGACLGPLITIALISLFHVGERSIFFLCIIPGSLAALDLKDAFGRDNAVTVFLAVPKLQLGKANVTDPAEAPPTPAPAGKDGQVVQTRYVLDKIDRALHEAGASVEDVVRTRIYVARLDDWRDVARAHGEVFGSIRPANTLIQVAGLVDGRLVEIEADSVIAPDDAL